MTIDPRRYVRRCLDLFRAERELREVLLTYYEAMEIWPALRDDIARLYRPADGGD